VLYYIHVGTKSG